MRILITGGKGMLGQDLTQVLSSRHEVVALGRPELDVTDAGGVHQSVSRLTPEVVIHCGAWTAVDACEADPDLAYRVNALGTRHVALACRDMGAAMAYISTDYVFDGAKPGPYLEWDRPNPLSVYGASKLAGEQEVQHLLSRYWVIRTSWLYGLGGPNFVRTILAKGEAGEPLRVVDDQIGAPTFTLDLARGVDSIVSEPLYGVWHLTNGGSCSWYDFASTILRLAGLRDVPLHRIDSDQLGRPAERPRNSVLRNFVWESQGWPLLRPWGDALFDYLALAGQPGA